MAVTITLFLFGKPGMELNEGEEANTDEMRRLGDELRMRLHASADLVDKLTGAGWTAQVGLYDVMLHHEYITTAVQAEEQLHNLGIDPEGLHIDEWEDEEDGLDFEGPE